MWLTLHQSAMTFPFCPRYVTYYVSNLSFIVSVLNTVPHLGTIDNHWKSYESIIWRYIFMFSKRGLTKNRTHLRKCYITKWYAVSAEDDRVLNWLQTTKQKEMSLRRHHRSLFPINHLCRDQLNKHSCIFYAVCFFADVASKKERTLLSLIFSWIKWAWSRKNRSHPKCRPRGQLTQ